MSGRLWLRSPFDRLRVSGKRRVPRLERALDEPVAHRLDLGSAVRLQALADDALVLPQDLARLRVAQALGHRRGALDVNRVSHYDTGMR
jgi:hypothetical protein